MSFFRSQPHFVSFHKVCMLSLVDICTLKIVGSRDNVPRWVEFRDDLELASEYFPEHFKVNNIADLYIKSIIQTKNCPYENLIKKIPRGEYFGPCLSRLFYELESGRIHGKYKNDVIDMIFENEENLINTQTVYSTELIRDSLLKERDDGKSVLEHVIVTKPVNFLKTLFYNYIECVENSPYCIFRIHDYKKDITMTREQYYRIMLAALDMNHFFICDWLLYSYTFGLEIVDAFENNFLHYLADSGNMNAAAWIIKKNPDLAHKRNIEQQTPLNMAYTNKNEEMYELLEQKNICITCYWPLKIENDLCIKCGRKYSGLNKKQRFF